MLMIMLLTTSLIRFLFHVKEPLNMVPIQSTSEKKHNYLQNKTEYYLKVELSKIIKSSLTPFNYKNKKDLTLPHEEFLCYYLRVEKQENYRIST